ncbi:hypothetical protein APY04_1313 [Hyphomicrobium sulfonivorans]|uniref:Gamma-glutamylcyclotransferase AIG2-like domain-containing protein n=1 Tax=Hyphomicrobium sulfonivorans TaxID=121290 RepID=A0A109BJA4_HYPSL|nr:gamma-glutamylcyclotransferase family protein [Hyphomicrobium sulfonivorans]KWT69813.1 hypothetical protein APY04_1313 [Hyphomicrobium sulfonivorans]
MSAPDTRYLFVYGTLMSGARTRLGAAERLRLAEQSDSLGPASLPHAKLYDLGRYPGIDCSGGLDDIVHGEAVLLADAAATFAWLDVYEDCAPADRTSVTSAAVYERVVQQVRLAGGETFDAWVYVLCRVPQDARRIDSGRWNDGAA